jgi:hypothetical protein
VLDIFLLCSVCRFLSAANLNSGGHFQAESSDGALAPSEDFHHFFKSG